jgi:hypothetical protein
MTVDQDQAGTTRTFRKPRRGLKIAAIAMALFVLAPVAAWYERLAGSWPKVAIAPDGS